MDKEKLDIIAARRYTKGADSMAVLVREVSGGNIDGSMFQLEVLKNNEEDISQRDTSGDLYHIRGLYYNELHAMLDGGWRKQSTATFAHRHSNDFNPEVL
jgi:hypothetical protein